MNQISIQEIESYIESKHFKNPKSKQPQISVLTNIAKIVKSCPTDNLGQILYRYDIGRSSSSQTFASSVLNDFESYRRMNKTEQLIQKEQITSKTSEQLKAELEQTESKALYLAEQKTKADLEAKEKFALLEQQRVKEAEIKKQAEIAKRKLSREIRIKDRNEGFISQDLPKFIQSFDYSDNIPKTAKVYYEGNGELEKFRTAMNLNKHAILCGKAGTGKTELVIKHAKENNIPLFKFSCSNDVRMSDLIGTKTISNDGNSIIFEAGMLTKAVLTANKNGCAILLLDEINTLAEKVQKNINGISDGTNFIDLPMGRISINKGVKFIICGTMNISYNGTNKLNTELLDRFVVITMPELSKDVKHKIYAKFAVSEQLENKLIVLSDKIDLAQKDNQLSSEVTFSTRSQIAFLEIYEELEAENIPDSITKSLDMCFVSKFTETEDIDKANELIQGVFN